MEHEKQRERLVELLKEADKNPWGREITNFEDIMEMLADYLLANNVVVLPENAMIDVNSRLVIDDDTKIIFVEEKYTIFWENKMPFKQPESKTIEIPKWTYDEHKGE